MLLLVFTHPPIFYSTFLPLWEMLQLELTQLASIHGEYSAVLTEQIEQPLRSAIPNNRDYADIHRVRFIFLP